MWTTSCTTKPLHMGPAMRSGFVVSARSGGRLGGFPYDFLIPQSAGDQLPIVNAAFEIRTRNFSARNMIRTSYTHPQVDTSRCFSRNVYRASFSKQSSSVSFWGLCNRAEQIETQQHAKMLHFLVVGLTEIGNERCHCSVPQNISLPQNTSRSPRLVLLVGTVEAVGGRTIADFQLMGGHICTYSRNCNSLGRTGGR